MEEQEPFYGAALARCPGIGSSRLQNLMAVLGSARAVWEADPADWQVPDFGETLMRRLSEFRRENQDLPRKLQEKCQKLGIRLLTIWDEDYPTMLKEIYDAPAILYVKGSIQQEAKRIAMVGARKFTPYGEGVAKSFGAGLAKAGLTVVSGGARGIDTASHKGALQVPGGRTVAVLGCGVDVVYPEENSYIENTDNNRILRLVFGGEYSADIPLIARLAMEKGIAANIIMASTKTINGNAVGSMLLSFTNNSDLIGAKEYFGSIDKIVCEVLKNV